MTALLGKDRAPFLLPPSEISQDRCHARDDRHKSVCLFLTCTLPQFPLSITVGFLMRVAFSSFDPLTALIVFTVTGNSPPEGSARLLVSLFPSPNCLFLLPQQADQGLHRRDPGAGADVALVALTRGLATCYLPPSHRLPLVCSRSSSWNWGADHSVVQNSPCHSGSGASSLVLESCCGARWSTDTAFPGSTHSRQTSLDEMEQAALETPQLQTPVFCFPAPSATRLSGSFHPEGFLQAERLVPGNFRGF